MNPIRITTTSLLVLSLISCATKSATSPDSVNPYGTADAGQVAATTNPPENPIYDTPAAYEESTTSATGTGIPSSPAVPATQIPNTPAPVVPKAPSNGAAIIHTVVAGDTLSGISAKYKVPATAIKQANSMTKDTVVLGRKMVIPPVQ